MNPDPFSNDEELPLFGDEADATYSIDVIAELAGIDSTTVLHYQETGLIRPVAMAEENGALFDNDCLRQLRRIEHLRTTCGMNDAGLKLFLRLLQEVEVLRQERRMAPG